MALRDKGVRPASAETPFLMLFFTLSIQRLEAEGRHERNVNT